MDVGVVTFITEVTRFSTIGVFFVVGVVIRGGAFIPDTVSSGFSSGSFFMSSTLTRGHVVAVGDAKAATTMSVCSSADSCFISRFSNLSARAEDVDDTSRDSSASFEIALAEASAAADARWFKLAATWSIEGCFLVTMREGEMEEVEQLGDCGDLGGEGVFSSNGLSKLVRAFASPAAIVTMGGMLVTGCWLRKASADGLGILRTEAFCCLTKEFWVILAFSYKEVGAEGKVVAVLMAIFSLAVADSESRCKFCKSSDIGERTSCFLMLLSKTLGLLLLAALVLVDIFCLILFRAISSELPCEGGTSDADVLMG